MIQKFTNYCVLYSIVNFFKKKKTIKSILLHSIFQFTYYCVLYSIVNFFKKKKKTIKIYFTA